MVKRHCVAPPEVAQPGELGVKFLITGFALPIATDIDRVFGDTKCARCRGMRISNSARARPRPESLVPFDEAGAVDAGGTAEPELQAARAAIKRAHRGTVVVRLISTPPR
jgi:hypothetical protein